MGKKKNALILPEVFFGSEVIKFKEEAYEKGRFDGFLRGVDQTVMTIHRHKGYSADLIADLTGFNVQYVQSVIAEFEKKD
jgi:hypothetical protein